MILRVGLCHWIGKCEGIRSVSVKQRKRVTEKCELPKMRSRGGGGRCGKSSQALWKSKAAEVWLEGEETSWFFQGS